MNVVFDTITRGCPACGEKFTARDIYQKHCDNRCKKRMQKFRKMMREELFCPRPDKIRFESMYTASRSSEKDAYRCVCGFAHRTSK